MILNKLLGLIIVGLAFTLLGLAQTSWIILYNPISLGTVIAITLGVVFFSYGNYVFALFKYLTQPIESQKDYLLAISFFDHLSNTFIAVGAITTLLGHIDIIHGLDSVESLMPATAVSYLSLFYGYVIARLLLEPLKQNIIRKAKLANINASVQQHISVNNEITSRYVLLTIGLSIASTIVLLSLHLMETFSSIPLLGLN